MSEHNMDAAKADIAGRIRSSAARAKGSGRDTLTAFADIGKALHEAKEVIGTTPKGAFGKWCDESGFGFSKEWRARLMRLADDWQGVVVALRWVEEKMGRIPGRKEYSVDGALDLVGEWLIADPEGAAELGPEWAKRAEEAEAKEREREAKKEQRKADKEAGGGGGDGEGGEGGGKASSAAELRKALAEALERIRILSEENAKLRGAKGKAKPDADKGPEAEAGTPPEMKQADKTRARKVYEYALRGGTMGERNAARNRLREQAHKAGVSLNDLLNAAGLDIAAYHSAEEADAVEAEAEAARQKAA